MGMKSRPKAIVTMDEACPHCQSVREHRRGGLHCFESLKQDRDELQENYDKLKEAAEHMASGIFWALKFLDVPGGGPGMMVKTKTNQVIAWQTDFMDALDKVGVVVDRDLYWADKGKKKTRRRRRA